MFKKLLTAVFLVALAGPFAVAQSGKVTIRFFHRWPMEPRFSYFNQLVSDFERQNPNIKIDMDSVENDTYKEKIRVLISSNNVPDVFCSWSDSFAANLVKSGRIKCLDPMLAKDPNFKKSFIQSQIKAFTFGGKIYGMPQDLNGKVFVYNKAIFAKAGIRKEPANFDELISTLTTLKNKGYNVPLLEGLANPWTISHYLGSIFQHYLPAEVLARDYNEATGDFTNPGYKIGLERFQKLVSFMGPNATSLTHNEVRNQFVAGTLPMMYLEIGEFSYIQAAKTRPDFGFFNFPAFADGKGDPAILTGAPEGFMMSNTSKHPEAAEKFFKFIFAKDNAAKFVKETGVPVSVLGAVNATNAYPSLIAAMNLMNHVKATTPWFDNAVNIKIADAFMRGAQAVATKDTTIDQVMADVQAAAKVVRSEAKK